MNLKVAKETLILLNLREIAGLLYIVCQPHPGLQPLLKPKPQKPPERKGSYWIGA
jgi:hypothetical protein